MARNYVLYVKHYFNGNRETVTQHFVDADSVQKVKYWFHRHYKQYGYTPDWATNKHTINVGGGKVVEIDFIDTIDDDIEENVLRDYLPKFPQR